MKKNYFTLFVGALLGTLLALYLVAFQLRINEKAVLTTFGKPTSSLNEPGLYWKLPWPFQKVYMFDSRLITDEGVFEETYTKDGKNLVFSTCIGWKIDDPVKFLESVGNVDDARRNLEGLVRTYKNGVMGNHEFSQLVSTDAENLKFEQIEKEILDPVSAESKLRYGIDVQFLYITRIGLPEQTTAKVFDRMRKEREVIAEKYRSEGDARAKEIKSEAESQRDQLLAQAQAEGKRIRGEGDAAAAQYYKTFEQNIELAIFLKKLETLKDTLKEKSTIILDTQTPPFDLIENMGNKNNGKQ